MDEIDTIFPTTDENPEILHITSWEKLGKQEYRITFDKDIASMGRYVLVRKD